MCLHTLHACICVCVFLVLSRCRVIIHHLACRHQGSPPACWRASGNSHTHTHTLVFGYIISISNSHLAHISSVQTMKRSKQYDWWEACSQLITAARLVVIWQEIQLWFASRQFTFTFTFLFMCVFLLLTSQCGWDWLPTFSSNTFKFKSISHLQTSQSLYFSHFPTHICLCVTTHNHTCSQEQIRHTDCKCSVFFSPSLYSLHSHTHTKHVIM